MPAHACNLPKRLRQKDGEFMNSLSYSDPLFKISQSINKIEFSENSDK